MEDTFEFLSFLLAIWGVVEIILFLKVWKMTNDVEKLKNKFVEGFNDEENGLYVNMDINSAVRKLYYLNNTEEAYALLNKYLYHTITYFNKCEVYKQVDGVDYSYVMNKIYSSEEWFNYCNKKVQLLYKAIGRDIPKNLALFDYEEYLKFGKE